jgi:hypothetical protein
MRRPLLHLLALGHDAISNHHHARRRHKMLRRLRKWRGVLSV